jgi:hypothetical protein
LATLDLEYRSDPRSLLSLLLRIRWEELAVFNYGVYAGRGWRLIPTSGNHKEKFA